MLRPGRRGRQGVDVAYIGVVMDPAPNDPNEPPRSACAHLSACAMIDRMSEAMRRALPRRLQGWVLTSVFLCAACGDEPATKSAPDPLAACAAFGGDAPNTIDQAVARLNALPEPADLPCFIASLPRPLTLVATDSVFSAQPADEDRSPRIFLFTPGLVLSVVPSGVAAPLLEFGEWITPTRTLKAEVDFPVQRPLAALAPYQRVHAADNLSNCGFCHTQEERHKSIPDAWVSNAFKLIEGTEVPLADVRLLRAQCDLPATQAGDAGAALSDPCPLLRAIFDYGAVEQGAFSPELKSFF